MELAKFFKNVTGIDVDAASIKMAKRMQASDFSSYSLFFARGPVLLEAAKINKAK